LLLSGSGREATVEILTAREYSAREIERIVNNKKLLGEGGDFITAVPLSL